MKAVVVGATGFLGTHLLSALAQAGVTNVLAVARTPRPVRAGLDADSMKITFVAGDSTDPGFVQALMKAQRPQVWFDLAVFEQTAMENLVQAWRKTPSVSRFVIAGTIAEYGFENSGRVPLPETAPLDGRGTYALGKIRAWQHGCKAVADHGFPLTWAVLPQLWGEHDPHGRDAVIGHRLSKGLAVVLRGNGRTLMPDGYAATAATAMAHLALKCEDPPTRVNIAGPKPLTPLQFVHWTAQCLGLDPKLTHIPHKQVALFESQSGQRFRNPFSDSDFLLDLTTLNKTGFIPPFSPRQGVGRTARWHASNNSPTAPAFNQADALVAHLSLDS